MGRLPILLVTALLLLASNFAFAFKGGALRGVQASIDGEEDDSSPSPASQTPEAFDFIVVGAGNAGAVVASRLSSKPNLRVLLLEEGMFSQDSTGDKMTDWLAEQIRVPRYDYRTWVMPQLTNWLWTEPNPGLNNRSGILLGPVITGKGLGGSTVVNIGAYTRPEPAYFDKWGLEGWSYGEVEPYFKKLEDYEGEDLTSHGKGGPVHVMHGDPHTVYPYIHQASLQMTPPLNGLSGGQPCHGIPQVYRAIMDGKRVDSYSAYLRPHLYDRPNLVVRTGARVDKVLIDASKRAYGVEYTPLAASSNEQPIKVIASKEVILSGGVIFTPHLLLKSGIGPRQELEALGMKVHADLPGVGKNLLARCNIMLFYGNKSVVPEMDPRVLLDPATKESYNRDHRGPLSLGGLGIYTVVQHRHHNYTDADYILIMTDVIPEVAPRMLSIGCANLRVQAPGSLSLKEEEGGKSGAFPQVSLNMMAHPDDRERVKRCLRDVRELMSQPALASLGYKEVFPTKKFVGDDDESLERWISRGYSFYSWHATGTAKMGSDDDKMAVVDARLRVRGGISGLRVVDASIFPDMIEAGPMATIYMLGEKAAHIIQQEHPPTSLMGGREQEEENEEDIPSPLTHQGDDDPAPATTPIKTAGEGGHDNELSPQLSAPTAPWTMVEIQAAQGEPVVTTSPPTTATAATAASVNTTADTGRKWRMRRVESQQPE